jgi:methylated-DNA-[protein]-cysteine S-methyltransferase
MKKRFEPSETLRRLLLSSPVGPLLVEHDGRAVHALHFWEQGRHPPAGTRVEPTRDDALGWEVARQLREYFDGTRRDFDLPLSPAGTEFQRRVWDALRAIPFGQTRSYGALAEGVGTPGGTRAVGQANRRNPIPVLVPCHRVTAAGGRIGGYMGATDGDGVARKCWLLEHERRVRGA